MDGGIRKASRQAVVAPRRVDQWKVDSFAAAHNSSVCIGIVDSKKIVECIRYTISQQQQLLLRLAFFLAARLTTCSLQTDQH